MLHGGLRPPELELEMTPGALQGTAPANAECPNVMAMAMCQSMVGCGRRLAQCNGRGWVRASDVLHRRPCRLLEQGKGALRTRASGQNRRLA
jgi:hypothetical protein